MAWLGIDPGMDGAVALIQPNGEVRFWDTPVLEVKTTEKTSEGKPKTRRLYDVASMSAIISSANIVGQGGILGCVLEKVHAMPEQGVSSSFSFGMGFGMWQGILAAKEIGFELVDPRRWTGLLLKDMPKGRGKETGAIRAGQLYPAASAHFRTPRGALLGGRTDALLLAHYAKISAESAR